MIIAVTGHRPDGLFGYDMALPEYEKLKEFFKDYLVAQGATKTYSGGALGIDILFAEAAIELKESGYDIYNVMAIPCYGQELKWFGHSQHKYHTVRDKMDKLVFVTNNFYNYRCMQLRNEYMVRACDKLLAMFKKTDSGGTYNCVEYAKLVKKNIDIINPLVIPKLDRKVWMNSIEEVRYEVQG